MYEKHFGLTRNPFNLTPDPALIYMTASHREALAGLAYAILERKGFVSLTGEVGTGKTTLLARTLKYLPTNRVVSSVIVNPILTESEFMELMMLDFGFPTVPASKAQRLVQFQDFLLRAKAAGKIVTLVVDEAHKLNEAVLEEIRLLSNMELPEQKLLQIVLAGQPELTEVLSRPELRQLNQRIAVRLSLQLLAEGDIEQYVRFRWSKAGTSPVPFTPSAYQAIAHSARGIPRLVNSICDTALTLTFAEKNGLVEPRHIQEACRDLGMVEHVDRPAVSHRNGSSVPALQETTDHTPITAPISAPLRSIRVLESYDKPTRSFWPQWIMRRRSPEQVTHEQDI